MEKIVGRTQRRIGSPNSSDLLDLARERVDLPDVDIELDYQDDVDTLIIRFKKPITEALLERLDDEAGVLPIYNAALTELIGIEILDISGQMQFADAT